MASPCPPIVSKPCSPHPHPPGQLPRHARVPVFGGVDALAARAWRCAAHHVMCLRTGDAQDERHLFQGWYTLTELKPLNELACELQSAAGLAAGGPLVKGNALRSTLRLNDALQSLARPSPIISTGRGVNTRLRRSARTDRHCTCAGPLHLHGACVQHAAQRQCYHCHGPLAGIGSWRAGFHRSRDRPNRQARMEFGVTGAATAVGCNAHEWAETQRGQGAFCLCPGQTLARMPPPASLNAEEAALLASL